jgi:hypothetical protein
MAKMFYTMDEAAERLKMDAAEVQALVDSGQLQEFRDGDRLMFKVDQVDLLGGDDLGEDLISLSDSTAGDALSASGSIGIGLDESDAPVETVGGVSIFDADTDDEADPSAATQITDKPMAAMDFSFDSAASGSGLADLALEQDDTSLGQDVLQDVYGDNAGSGSDDSAAGSLVGGSEFGLPANADGGDLFESAPAASSAAAAPVSAGVPGAALAEAYDGTWSGISAGLAVGVVVAVLAALVFVIGGLAGASPDVLLGSANQMTVYIVLGAAAGVMLIGAVLGFVMMRRS